MTTRTASTLCRRWALVIACGAVLIFPAIAMCYDPGEGPVCTITPGDDWTTDCIDVMYKAHGLPIVCPGGEAKICVNIPERTPGGRKIIWCRFTIALWEGNTAPRLFAKHGDTEYEAIDVRDCIWCWDRCEDCIWQKCISTDETLWHDHPNPGAFFKLNPGLWELRIVSADGGPLSCNLYIHWFAIAGVD